MKPGWCGLPVDYYWREYTGSIPRDAVEGGRGPNNCLTYIGQVSVREHGIIPVTIYPGNTSVVAAVYGVHHVNLYIKILCSSTRESLRWIQADSANFHVQTANLHLVRGGVEGDLLSYIGRIRFQGETIVAKVRQHGVGNVRLYFPVGEEEKSADSFEILVYNR
ncbi:uncharacterized protein LOC108904404 [Anoplophora glabripennis]|uniref:uncharacterized protein LOC108904404 n=1 Tax=Anoplophora glabripennis TaxID=217634 RepID=UPI000874EA6A|nr:uncharacterized protein LOC108904404 [Anoplophora glabripennis]XP_018562466.1 uncharacterized protein LOC108904404 [Anoplophora glabripennis]